MPYTKGVRLVILPLPNKDVVIVKTDFWSKSNQIWIEEDNNALETDNYNLIIEELNSFLRRNTDILLEK